ncbi:MAG: alpha/beta hydrolase [Roseiflexaceae bacterium]
MNDQLRRSEPVTAPQIDIVLRDGGRRVAVHRLAEGDSGRTVVVCHPAPGAGMFDPDPQQTWARNLTLLAADRPGYGQSDPVPNASWASVDSAVDDLAAMLDRAGCGPVGVVGWSAGGRVALALAARRPELIDRVVVLSTPAPHEQVPWIPPDQQAALDALRGFAPDAAHAVLSQQCAPLIARDARATDRLSLLAASAADESALAIPGARARLIGMLEAAFVQGVTGLASDIAGYCLQPWGFAPEAVQAKTLLLYGSKDPVAGSRHGAWWQKRLPNARLEVGPGAGHLLILSMWQRALSHLAPGSKR